MLPPKLLEVRTAHPSWTATSCRRSLIAAQGFDIAEPEALDMNDVEVDAEFTAENKVTLAAQVRKRATHRGQITRLINDHTARVEGLQR